MAPLISFTIFIQLKPSEGPISGFIHINPLYWLSSFWCRSFVSKIHCGSVFLQMNPFLQVPACRLDVWQFILAVMTCSRSRLQNRLLLNASRSGGVWLVILCIKVPTKIGLYCARDYTSTNWLRLPFPNTFQARETIQTKGKKGKGSTERWNDLAKVTGSWSAAELRIDFRSPHSQTSPVHWCIAPVYLTTIGDRRIVMTRSSLFQRGTPFVNYLKPKLSIQSLSLGN